MDKRDVRNTQAIVVARTLGPPRANRAVAQALRPYLCWRRPSRPGQAHRPRPGQVLRASGPPVLERVRDAEPVLPRHHGIRGPAQARRPARQARLHEFPGAAREGRGRRLTNPPSRWWMIVAIGSLLRDTVEAVRRLPHCRGPGQFSSWNPTTAVRIAARMA